MTTKIPGLSKQRIIDRYVVKRDTDYLFKVSALPHGYPTSPDIVVIVNNAEIKESALQTNGYVLEVINNIVYVNLGDYLSVLFQATQSQPPVVEINTYTTELLSANSRGYFQIPQQLEANPLQQEISEISGSNLSEHFASIIKNQEGFSGTAFGGPNNYRDSPKNKCVGTTILQNKSPMLKTMLVSSSAELDVIAGIRYSQAEYTKFKNRYLSTALQLINQQFDPQEYYDETIIISAWVEEILKIVNVSKEFSNAFAYSYMIAHGAPFAEEDMTVDSLQRSATLTKYVDLSDPTNSLYVYDATTGQNNRLLLIDVDYRILSINLAIEIEVLADPGGDQNLHAVLYKNSPPAYIPSTPTVVGAYNSFIPRIEMDYSYVDPTEVGVKVIIGHDGSKTLAYNDYRDNLLLELESRIYNSLQPKFRNQYYIPLRIEAVKPGAFRNTKYTREEFLKITEPHINKWATKNKANYRLNNWAEDISIFEEDLSQIWKLYNYTDAVSPCAGLKLPGNWRGIFLYFYDTCYPDTRPWEMLGFSGKPVWWSTEYGDQYGSTNTHMWSDLELGIIRQGPSAIFKTIISEPSPLTYQDREPDDIVTYVAQPQQMWARPGLDTILPVDGSGILKSAMDIFHIDFSGNLSAPFEGFDKDWVYGDGSPVEHVWMNTSEYAYSTQEFLYLMKPAAFGELLWDTLGTDICADKLTIPNIDGPVLTDINWQYVQNDRYTSTNPLFAWMRPKNAD